VLIRLLRIRCPDLFRHRESRRAVITITSVHFLSRPLDPPFQEERRKRK
jgi:hypothetical protein